MPQIPRLIPRYTVADYEQWEGKWELWDGIPVAMTPSPSSDHQGTGAMLVAELLTQLKRSDGGSCQCRVAYELDWRIDEEVVVCPDVVIACPAPEAAYLQTAPVFIAELLSPSTAQKDRVSKRKLYADEGVKYYFIIDHVQREAEALELRGGSYRPLAIADGSYLLELHPGCEISLDLGNVWL